MGRYAFSFTTALNNEYAKLVRKPQSFVSKRGQRRIDVLELLRIVEAL